jgi:hypothetical protein
MKKKKIIKPKNQQHQRKSSTTMSGEVDLALKN